MELIELNAKKRDVKGKGAARKLRKSLQIPAIVYGVGTEPAKISLETAEFDRIIRENGTTGLFLNLKIDSGEKKAVMLKELQMDPMGLQYFHVDLYQVDMDEKVSVSIPVDTTGTSEGVKEGGLLQIIRRELQILCKPADTPDSIVLDISGMNIGDAIHVEDIDLGDAIEIPHDVNFTVITIVPPTTEEDEAETEEEDEEAIIVEEEEPAAEE